MGEPFLEKTKTLTSALRAFPPKGGAPHDNPEPLASKKNRGMWVCGLHHVAECPQCRDEYEEENHSGRLRSGERGKLKSH